MHMWGQFLLPKFKVNKFAFAIHISKWNPMKNIEWYLLILLYDYFEL